MRLHVSTRVRIFLVRWSQLPLAPGFRYESGKQTSLRETILRCEEFGEERKHVRAGGFVKLAKAFDQTALINGSDLIEYDLP